MLVSCFLFYYLSSPMIIQQSFQLLTCIPYEDGHSYLKPSPSIQCYSSSHSLLALPLAATLILTYGLLFPLAVAGRLWLGFKRDRAYLNNKNTLTLFGLFYVGLRDEVAPWWEVVGMNARKLGFILLSSLV